jgi:hypothetical protein
MITSLENQKLDLIERILSLKDVSLLSQINETVNSLINHSDKKKATLPMLTREDIMDHIEQSRRDFQDGNYTSHEDFKKIAKSW